MRLLRLLPALILIALLWILSHPIGALPAIGTMLDPVNGMMAAAEPVDKDFNANLKLRGVQAPVEVWFEDRLVPHVRAQNDHDLYLTQGYIHAYFRLWQMDMQTRAAGGRVSEVAGEKALEFDRGQRRKGMVWGAEASLKAMEADPRTRDMLNAYRDGINAYIATLNFRELPIEYKLMGFRPERWTNLRSALLLKYMADDLTGKTDDIAFTLLRDQLGEEQFNYLFPERIPGSKPVIPEGTKFDPPSLKAPPVPEGEIWAHFDHAPGKAKAPSRPPRKGEEVLGKHLAYQTATVLGTFPTCHLPPSVGACKGTRGAQRDGGLVQPVVDSLEVRNAAANVRNAEKYLGDGEKHSRNASSDNGDAKKHIHGGSANIHKGVANVRNAAADVGDGETYIGDETADVRNGVADIGGAKSNIGWSPAFVPCHPEPVEGRCGRRTASSALALSVSRGEGPYPGLSPEGKGDCNSKVNHLKYHNLYAGTLGAGTSQTMSPSTLRGEGRVGGPHPSGPCNFAPNDPNAEAYSGDGSGDPDVAVGSNNWAISGEHTASGKPILCNDPHLGLNLPSLWFEMQLTAPGINSYGVSLPGAPGIVIGYNEKISWGFTNNYRDVKDFYKIDSYGENKIEADWWVEPKDWKLHGRTHYRSYGPRGDMDRIRPFDRHIESIKIKGGAEYFDTVLYTVHGPVMYDPSFPDPAKTGALLACTWMAHRGTNELLALYLVNRAGDYQTFTQAIQHFECPAQNFVYADISGNIAMWGQGRFINKWKGQGKFVMNGSDSSTLWGESIPMSENPHVLNPPQGYVASANQQVTDSTYPYWYNGNFTEWRSWEINGALERFVVPLKALLLNPGQKISLGCVSEQIGMDQLQNSNVSLLAGKTSATEEGFRHFDQIPFYEYLEPESKWWTNTLDDTSTAATKFQIYWGRVYFNIWNDEFSTSGTRFPSSEQTVKLLQSDSLSIYYDNKHTPQRETLRQVLSKSLRETSDSLSKLRTKSSVQWYQVKNTSLTHLAKLPAFSYDHLKIGGWGNTINAVSGNHGPSWRMIVEMDSLPRAYAIYPGGQSGNPGSRHYGDNVQQWVDGKYNELRFLPRATSKNPFRYTWTISG